MDAPGGRYKIIERGRRLVTIDTLTGQEVTTLPETSSPPITDTGRDKITAAPVRASGSSSSMGGPDRGVQSMGTSRSSTNNSLSKPASFDLTSIAAQMPGARRDETGRILLMTQPYYDPRGPRLVRLTPAKAQTFGGMGVALALIAVFALFVGFAFSFIFVFVIGFALLRSGKATLKPMMASLVSDAEDVG